MITVKLVAKTISCRCPDIANTLLGYFNLATVYIKCMRLEPLGLVFDIKS